MMTIQFLKSPANSNEEDFNLEKLKQADLVIFCGPRLKFTEQEVRKLIWNFHTQQL